MAKDHSNQSDMHGGRLRVPRSRGAFSGLLLIILGAWGALVPLVGPYVDFGYTPNSSFYLSSGRVWLEIVPGAVAFAGGVLLLIAANRLVTSLGAWMAAAAGAWFLVGPTLNRLLDIGTIGLPIHTSSLGSMLETLLLFTGIGSVILFVGAVAVGRLGVVGVRDVKAAQRRESNKDDKDSDTDESAQHNGHHTAPSPTPARNNPQTEDADGYRTISRSGSDGK